MLGTCLGVTLIDPKKKVGGLIHLLLPEPVGDASAAWIPEKYASTGMPLFIAALKKLGADPKQLRACIAGGALLGPVSDMDMALDIGGRTAEIVRKILHDEGIPIFQSETGGYFGRRLRLDLSDFTTSIKPLFEVDMPQTIKVEKLTDKQITSMINSVRPIPQIVLKIMRMTEEGEYNMNELAQEIRQDQVISGRVIHLVNSTFIGVRNKVDSIDRALVITGEQLLLRIIISAAVEPLFPETSNGYSLTMGGLYQHALGTAIVAEDLANFTGVVSSSTAYTAGLLHDIGKTALDQHLGKSFPLFYTKTRQQGEDLISVEQELFGLDHTQVGKKLAEIWELPENITEAMVHHHNPEEARVDPKLACLVAIADVLMYRFQAGRELDKLNLDLQSILPWLKKVSLKPDQIPTIIDRIPQRIFEHSLPMEF